MNDALIAVPASLAARLAGVSERRLKSWDSIGLLGPRIKSQLSERNTVRLYEFEELVELRVVVALQDRGLNTQHINRIIGRLRKNYSNPLRQLTFAVKGRELLFKHPDGRWEGDRLRDQVVLEETLNLEAVRIQVRRDLGAKRNRKDARIVNKRNVLGSKAVIEGTRTPVEALIPYFDRGYTSEQIREEFPHLSSFDIAAARKVAKKNPHRKTS